MFSVVDDVDVVHGRVRADIHMGNVLYDDTKDGRKYVWNDFDKGIAVVKTRNRRRLELQIEKSNLKAFDLSR